MPITKSAKKSLKSSLAKQARNQKLKKNLEISLKKVSKETVSATVSLVDKAAKRGLIHKNKAARVKSQLSKRLGALVPARKSSGATAKTATKPKTTTSKTKKVTKKTA
jgi:small subunit ribosomal protein S20